MSMLLNACFNFNILERNSIYMSIAKLYYSIDNALFVDLMNFAGCAKAHCKHIEIVIELICFLWCILHLIKWPMKNSNGKRTDG